jgi:hypothetical protein
VYEDAPEYSTGSGSESGSSASSVYEDALEYSTGSGSEPAPPPEIPVKAAPE